ncbi:MAG: M20 aminoacylase family protein [Methylococcales bacterium]|nr:M20 aminoacylase family protein [Methylococcales bacterium]
MSIPEKMTRLDPQMRQWRHHLHQFPETAYQEVKTAAYVKQILNDLGLQVHSGLGKTGLVACLSRGESTQKIALRADIDALPINEKNTLPYKSQHSGKMHACGHDGHTAMLLGAAAYLVNEGDFNGTVYFIFQPAEEAHAGAKAMIDEGLFDLFPADSVYGLHNFPGFPQGHFGFKKGAVMASFDCFEITLTGQGTHAAMPHLGDDLIVAASQLVGALQTIVSRQVDPTQAAVVSITQIHAGDTWNALPDNAVIRGTFRCFTPSLQNLIREQITQISDAMALAQKLSVEVVFNPDNVGYPVTINTAEETAIAKTVAEELIGKDKVFQPTPSMGSEDFAFMLQQKPGCYAWIGNGSTEGGCLLHNPHYDFNDDNLILGASYWVKLVQKILAV